MTPTRLAILFGLVFVVALVALAPLRLIFAAVPPGAVTVADVRGSIWRGMLEGTRYGALHLGDVRVGVSHRTVTLGAPAIGFRTDGELALSGVAVLGGRWGVAHLEGIAPVQALDLAAPVQGVILFDDVTALFAKGACTRAGGAIGVEQLRVGVGAATVSAAPMAGEVVCGQAGEAQAQLQGTSAEGATTALAKLFADGRYTMDITVAPANPSFGQGLALMGFAARGDGYGRTIEGRWRDG